VVGGTAQYLYALIDNWQIPAVKEDKKLRARLEKEIAQAGLPAVYDKLLALDPEAAYVVAEAEFANGIAKLGVIEELLVHRVHIANAAQIFEILK